jgi:ectoine hydroxylase-related dioxygenase (phytanoyl-CoA dioxygenase family)
MDYITINLQVACTPEKKEIIKDFQTANESLRQVPGSHKTEVLIKDLDL